MGVIVSKDGTQAASFSLPDTYLVLGLGNVGKKYEQTRHNAGFLCLDAYQEHINAPTWRDKSRFKASVSEYRHGDDTVVLAKPTTLMNNSGEALRALQDFYRIPEENVLVVYDELDLPFGTLRSRRGGGVAGHNGAASIVLHGHEDFARIRIGIANDHKQHVSGADFVLKNFAKSELAELPNIYSTTNKWIENFITGEFEQQSTVIN